MELFKRYNYIISTTFLIVFAISIILFYLQFNSRYEHEVIQVKNQIQERLLNLDYMIKVATNQIDAMQIAAQSSCLTFDKKYYIPSALFSQLADGEDYYHLDNFKPPYNKNLIGNLTGTGSFQNRSADYYREIGMAFKLNSYFQATVHNIPNIAWVYYTSANGFANLYPWVASKDFKFTEEFYNHEFYQLGLPEHNPEHKRYWTSAYIDEAGKGLMVSCAAPVYRGDIFRGTVALDFTLDVLNTFVKGFKEQHTTLFISNQNNQLLAHPTLVSSKDKTVKPVAVAFPETIREQSAQLLQTQNGEIQETDSHLFFHQNLENAPWQLIALIPKQEIIINAIYETSWGFLVLLPGLALILIMTSFLTRKEFIKPARMLVKHIENEGINAPVILPVGWQTWFESVTKTFHENRNLVTELQASLTSLERKNIELQQLDKTKDEFLANTSHELRTPLYGIIGIAESLTDGATGKLNQFTNNSLNMIVNSGKRLSTLVNDILDFSKLKHKELELQLKPVSLRAMAEVVIFLNKPSLGNLQIINSIPKDLPAVYADENRLQQILYNLIGNAIKFTDFGTIEISAKIIANEQLEITIADTGVGIDEENLAKIFQSFEQADGSTAREYGGTGLGLAITKQLIELHNGKIWVKSKLEVGSQFIFTLPITKSLSKMSPSSTAKYAKELLIEPVDIIMPTQTEGLFTILIVDDEPVNIQILINFLSSLNYNIIRANSGKEACTLFEQGIKPDIVLLDVMMPGMTGYETAKKIRQHFPINELPILMLTAKNQISDLVTGLRAGANDYLTKPVAKNELLARVKMHLHLHNLNAAYSRFVPHEFLKFLNKESIVDIRLGDHVEQEMTVLFADIRDFTSLSESMTPQQNFNLINSYLRRMEPVIRQHHGFIDKYIGDSIMALFPKADEAVQAGINMLHILREYNVTRGQPQRPKLNIGVGIHTGKLMLGTIGGEHRMDSTVIADAVNLASRLESTNKIYGTSLIISEDTLNKLTNQSQYSKRFLDKVKVKGRLERVNIFEVFDADEPQVKLYKQATIKKFEQATNLYQKYEFAKTKELMQECLQDNPQDKVADTYIKRCQKFLQTKQNSDWGKIAQAVHWTSDLLVNQELIDAQHKELFNIIKNLIISIGSKNTEEVTPTISFLEDYIVSHFALEENYMQQYNIPNYAEHKADHEYFKKNFQYIKEYYQQNGESLHLSLLIQDQIVDWLINHIKKMDQELALLLQEDEP